jgi:uncharacterized membrane protein
LGQPETQTLTASQVRHNIPTWLFHLHCRRGIIPAVRDIDLNVCDQSLTLGERVADKLADFGGSWRFIGIFAGALFLWMAMNSTLLVWKPFDPYPFIFLNLILSCLAAIQAPVIMMSQNRQEARDRLQAEHDYRVNLKAELEIRHLHEKIDHLLMNQWQRLLEIQQIQMDLMEEVAHKEPRKKLQ